MMFTDILKEKISPHITNSTFEIELVKVSVLRQSFYLYFVFEQALQFEEYALVVKETKEFFNDLQYKAECIISYKNENFSGDEWIIYLRKLMSEMTKTNFVYSALVSSVITYEGDRLVIHLEEDATPCDELLEVVNEEFLSRGLDMVVVIQYDVKKTLEDIRQDQNNLQELTMQKQFEVTQEVKAKTEKFNEISSRTPKTYVYTATPIKEIPHTQAELMRYSQEEGLPNFRIRGEIFAKELKPTPKSKRMTLKIYDGETSIAVQKWCGRPQELEVYNSLNIGDIIEAEGDAVYSIYDRNVILEAKKIKYIGKKVEDIVQDTAPIKRVELHCHTKMTTLDGLTEAKEYIKTAKAWGHRALAITDLDGLLAIPDLVKDNKDESFLPIIGTELNFLDDEKYFIALDPQDIKIQDATYIVFDVETTGLSQKFDEIIEIAAYKVYKSGIIDTFETFVKPTRAISKKIENLTSITDEMLADAPSIATVLPQFLEFAKDCVFVAHNAVFDMGMIYAAMKQLGIYTDKTRFPAIDTLNGLRVLHHKDLKKFNLSAMAKYYKVKQERHHRANDDTRVTAECFVLMQQEFIKAGCTNINEINSLIDKDVHFKYLFPNHITLLCKNQKGYKNLYKIVSDALTVHCNNEGILLKSVLDQYREDILVGSACFNGRVFEAALFYSEEEMIEAISYCDYIEVQPPLAYRHYFDDLPNGIKDIESILLRIITAAKAQNKLVVATSNCHYLRPELKKYRDILIASPQIGGGLSQLSRYNESPDAHLRTTNEMLEEFSFLDQFLRNEIVIENTNKITDLIERIQIFPKQIFVPADDEFKDSLGIPSIMEEVKRIVWDTCRIIYGENPHQIVKDRIEYELNCIIGAGYSSVYFMSYLLVSKSNADGYLVGSRGSVGSSLVATMMDITEINPLVPHYRCRHCHFQAFRMSDDMIDKYGITDMEQSLQSELIKVESGYDLNNAVCPVCGKPLDKEGQDIPFETFLGFKGDKVPDIDLNFSGEYQAIAHEYVRELMGSEHAFRGGTTSTLAEKNAYGYVQGYNEKKNLNLSSCEVDRLKTYLVGVRRSSGQHPGGIVVVPKINEIYDVTPIQYPANNVDNPWRTTHYDYHSFEDNLLKLDILGHDDPTVIKFLLDYVHEHPEEFPFSDAKGIPIDDKEVYKMFCSTEVLGLSNSDIDSKIASFAVPEFGTNFVRNLLVDTLPSSFAELVKVSGLSHGTDVWEGNAKDLLLGKTNYGKIPFNEIICCRDDIMIGLSENKDFDPKIAFEIMEFVRKGRVDTEPEKWAPYLKYMQEHGIPEWYIWACGKIKYLFPKAHAAAYVTMALRIAWFKFYKPKLFYSAWFSKRAKNYCINDYLKGPEAIRSKIYEINTKSRADKTAKDEGMLTALEVALEMTCRGVSFLPVDIFKSDALIFTIEEEGIRCPFASVDGLGESAALDIVEKREEKLFTSKKDVMKRTKLNQTLFEEFNRMRAFGDLPEEEAAEAIGLFAFL